MLPLRNLALLFLATALLGACSSPIPDHARYIPKDAVAMAGINLKGLSKKIAWNVITGSKLFKEMQDRIPEKGTKDAMNGIEKSGIDFANTVYVYVKTDARFKGGNRITGLVPLSDAGQWEVYVKQVLPQAVITQHGDRKEASLGTDMYVGWNKKVLIMINLMAVPDEKTPAVSGVSTSATGDNTAISAEMQNAFSVANENSIKGNKYFSDLELQGHDISFLLNYDLLMTQMSGTMAEKTGMSLNCLLWKDAAFTAGFDFIKGKITGDMHYFMPGMKDIGTELGATSADKDMLDRLPNQNLDMLLGMHIAPKAIKGILEKMSLLGTANIGLATQGLNVDNVLSAFTGDMAIVMNNFSLKTEKVTDNFMGQAVVHDNQKPSVDLTYVIKLNKKEEFQKLVKLAKDNGLPASGNGFVIPIDANDSVYILMNDQFAVASNKYVNATGVLAGKSAQKMPEPASSKVYSHPTAFYLDIQQLLKNIDPSISHSAHDSAMISESKKLLNNVSFNGGEFKNDAFEYHLDINFMNTDENSLINLMDYGMKMSDADKIKGASN
jgi:hypothetical protein